MGRLYIVPIYLTEPRFRTTSGYVPGIYEVSDTLKTGPLRSLMNNERLVSELLVESCSDIPELFDIKTNDSELLYKEALEQWSQLLALLKKAATCGLLQVHWLKDIQNLYDGVGRLTEPAPLFKIASKPVEISHGLFRIYGICFAKDLLVVTDVVIKMTKKMSDDHRSRAENFKSILVDESELECSDFQGKILELHESSTA